MTAQQRVVIVRIEIEGIRKGENRNVRNEQKKLNWTGGRKRERGRVLRRLGDNSMSLSKKGIVKDE